MMLMKLVWTV